MAQRFACGILRRGRGTVLDIYGDYFNFPPRGASVSVNVGHLKLVNVDSIIHDYNSRGTASALQTFLF